MESGCIVASQTLGIVDILDLSVSLSAHVRAAERPLLFSSNYKACSGNAGRVIEDVLT